MKRVLFYILLGAFLIEAFLPFRLSPITGLSLKNIASYLTLMFLMISEFALGGIRNKKVPAITILLLIILGTALNIAYIHLTEKVPISLVSHLIRMKMWIIDPFILYFMIFLLIDNEKQARQSLLSILTIFSIINIVSWFTVKYNIHLFKQVEVADYLDTSGRFSGAYENANQMAYFLCFLIPYMYYFLKKTPHVGFKIFLLILINASMVSIALSGSRGGVIAMGIVCASMVYLYKDFKVGIFMMIFIALFITISLFTGSIFVSKTVERVSVLAEGDAEKASNYRLVIWKGYLLKVLAEKPSHIITGIGFGLSREALIEKRKINASPHNMYLQVLVEFGLFGLIVFMIFIFRLYFFVKGSMKWGNADYHRVILISSIAILFGWCFSELVTILKYLSMTFSTALVYAIHMNKDSKQFLNAPMRKPTILHQAQKSSTV